MTSSELRIALVGCGNWGRHILRDLRELGAHVTVVARSEESIERARAGGAEAIVDDVGALRPGSIDGVVVATPTITHGDVIASVLPLDVPVFVEKPMTADLASARALVATAGDRIFVMDKWRYHPGIETLGALARSGTYGALQGVETTRHQWGNIHRDVDVVWILAPHDLSIGVEILGHLPSPVSAVAERSQGQLSGLRATLGSGRPGDAEWLTLSVSSRSPVWNRGVLVHTDSAVLALHDSYDDHVAVYPSSGLTFGDPPPPERIPVSTEFPLRRELDAFLGHLAGGPPPKTSATDGLASIECIVALRSLAGIEPDAGDTP